MRWTNTETQGEDRVDAPLDVKLKASGLIARASGHRPFYNLGASAMAEPTSSAGLGVLLAKLLPAGIGAALMVAVDPPESKGELFARVFVAFAASYLFGDVLFDFLHSFSLFSFLNHATRAHAVAVDGIMGAAGWFVLGGLSMYLKKFRHDPAGAIAEAKEAAKP